MTLILVCFGLTLAALFTPSWAKIDLANGDINGYVPREFGLFPFSCSLPELGSQDLTCLKWFNVS